MPIFHNEWNDDVVSALGQYMFISWPIGTWPLQKNEIFARVRSLTAIFLQLLALIVLYREISQGCTQVRGKLMEVLVIMSCNVLAILKIIAFHVHNQKLYSNYTAAVKDYSLTKDENDLSFMRRHARLTKFICLSATHVSIFCTCLYMVGPFAAGIGKNGDNSIYNNTNFTNIEGWLPLPVPLNCALKNTNLSKTFYGFIYIFEGFVLILTCMGNTGDAFNIRGLADKLCTYKHSMEMKRY